MLQYLKQWFNRNFSDPELIILLLMLGLTILVLMAVGHMLIPVFVSLVLAYLLQWLVTRLEAWRVPHKAAVGLVFTGFLGAVVIATVDILPLVWHQLVNFFNELPNMLGHGQALLAQLPDRYPDFISPKQVEHLLDQSKLVVAQFGQLILSASLTSIPGMISLAVYLIIVPLLIFFFLMDKAAILSWLKRFLPEERELLVKVWNEVHVQIGNYVRGRVFEMLVVSVVCFLVFSLMHLNYAMLLSLFIGFSVIIPYIGAVIVTIPVVAIALLQWGWTPHFAYIILAYAIIIIVDANIFVPLLFSEAVKLHPVAIILAVLVFGGLWGLWGIFFAIPLATLVKAVLNVWYQRRFPKG